METFHLSSFRPQKQYQIFPNNSNQRFPHPLLPKTTSQNPKPVHPLESFCPSDFIDRKIALDDLKPIKPNPLDSIPFKLVENVDDLCQLARKLECADEFAVDLEHNSYRSFQGLTCLMQISTRKEDFVVDTLKLRRFIGPCLRGVFGDPRKRKVMHGACNDIVWLQRDFGIYVCNLFDTMEASKVLKLQRKSLAYLLMYFCGVLANKEYQTSDWRIRPLPDDMVKYAREDTHYLLFIYDMMRKRLASGAEYMNFDEPLLEVYKKSFEVCSKLYEKELFTETSYLKMPGLREANLSSEQLSVAAALFRWRDGVARVDDESTEYVLPNKLLIEIAKQLPRTESELLGIVAGSGNHHPYVECNVAQIVRIVSGSNLKARPLLINRCVPAYMPCVPVYRPVLYPSFSTVGRWHPQQILYWQSH